MNRSADPVAKKGTAFRVVPPHSSPAVDASGTAECFSRLFTYNSPTRRFAGIERRAPTPHPAFRQVECGLKDRKGLQKEKDTLSLHSLIF